MNRLPSEVLLQIFQRVLDLSDSSVLLECALTCKSWSYLALQLIWHKPILSKPQTWLRFSKTLALHNPYIHYASHIRNINLSAIPEFISDDSLIALSSCNYLDRMTLAGCSHITNSGLVQFINQDVGRYLIAIDLSDIKNITDETILHIAHTCHQLQGLNLSLTSIKEDTSNITDKSIIKLAEQCKNLRKVRLANWKSLTDASLMALVDHCPGLLEIDVTCNMTNKSLVQTFQQCRELRELKLNGCQYLNDLGFLSMPACHQLRLLELSSVNVSDQALEAITLAAPRIRHLVLWKCVHVTDDGVASISRLGRHLHHLHLGGCRAITDTAIVQLSSKCARLRYIDLSSCHQLGDDTVVALATMPRLKRIGLVKCHRITDRGILAFTRHGRTRVSLERIHLSYCEQLTLTSISALLVHCKRLSHVSLSFIPAFRQEKFSMFSMLPPKEFNADPAQFCVFSGQNLVDLRGYLKAKQDLETNQFSKGSNEARLAQLIVDVTKARLSESEHRVMS